MDLVSSPKKPIQSAFYEKRGDKGLLFFKKKNFYRGQFQGRMDDP